ncbi:MAG: phage major capsid protein [Chitinispirillaceae bacterium]|nr:phage major capsid protein [Chitinispirillaceae bacterium]
MPRKDIMKLKRERNEHVLKMRAMITTAENRSDKKFTDDETRQYNELQIELDRRDEEIKREERLQAAELETTSDHDVSDPETNYRSFGEFLVELRTHLDGSDRLIQRAVTASSGPSMAFVVPDQYDTQIRQIGAQAAIVRPRAFVIPAGDPPDAKFNMTVLDQSGDKGVFSGVVVKWIGENQDRTDAGDPKIQLQGVEPQEVQAYIDISDKLLLNAPASEAFVKTLLGAAISAAEDREFYKGNGVKKPRGIVGHDSAIKVKRTTVSSVKYDDVVNMLANFLFGGSPVWVASQSILPNLMKMEDSEGHLVWQNSAREGMPSTLAGFPVLFNQRSPRVGSNGDLALVDFKYYAIKDGSSLAMFMDPYTQKKNGLTRIYASWNVDGQPMLKSPLLTENGIDKISPFVTLE